MSVSLQEAMTVTLENYPELRKRVLSDKGSAEQARRSFGSRNTAYAVKSATQVYDALVARKKQLDIEAVQSGTGYLNEDGNLQPFLYYKVMNQSHHCCNRISDIHGKVLKLTANQLHFYSSQEQACGGCLSLLPVEKNDPRRDSAIEAWQFDDVYREEKKNERKEWLEE